MIGQTISHYRILRKLGTGGMGVVYLAEDTLLGRQVAIKTLNDGGIGRQHFRTRFLREAVAISSFSHPNIATIYEYGHTTEGQPYIVMEFVKGQTLADLITQRNLTVERAIEIMTDVSRALGEAHRRGIVHRDIKPSNIAINESGRVKVLDFGLAKRLETSQATADNGDETQTREGVMIGTPMYVSPEQAMGLPVDERSDLFSLGSVLYECLASKPPFAGRSPVEICAKVIRDDPPPPSNFNSLVPSELDRLILKSLAKKPENRYQCAETWIRDLHSVSEGIKAQSTGDNIVAPAREIASNSLPHRPTTLSTSKVLTVFTRPRLSLGFLGIAGLVIVLTLIGLYFALQPTPYRPSPAAKQLYETGINNLHEGSYVKAIDSFQKAISIDDNFAMAHGGLAEAYIELDHHERAQKEALQAIALANSSSSTVSPEDWLYLQGIKAIILQSFDQSIGYFEQRVGRVSSAELNTALLELGRSYEKKEDFQNAEKTYLRITNDAREYPLVLLRLGVLAGRKQEFDRARSYFDQGQALFQQRDNKEGITEAHYERGSVLITAQNTNDAAAELQKALDLARNVTRSKYQEIRVLLKLSSVAKEQGKAEEAKSLAIEATKEAAENNMPSLKTQGLIQTGKVFLFNREYPEAGRYFTEAVTSAEQYTGLSTGAEAKLSLGTLYVQQEENVDEGLKLIEGAVAFYQKGGHSREWWRAMLWLGRARIQRGDYEGAQKTLDDLLGQVQQSNDVLLVADTHFEKGILLAQQELYPQALHEFDESRKRYETLNNPTKTGYAWLYCSEMLWRFGDYPGSEKALVEAEKRAERKKSSLSIRIALNRVQVARSRGKFNLAITQGSELLAFLGDGYKRTAIELKYTLGAAHVLAGMRQGLRECEEAAERATNYPDPRLWANALLALAEAKLAYRDPAGALQNATQAAELFSKAKQWDSNWRANVVASQAAQRLNDYESARKYLLLADSTLATLRSIWGDEEFKSYLLRSDIKRYIELLHQAPDVAR
jgi:serine/threonine protein kinase